MFERMAAKMAIIDGIVVCRSITIVIQKKGSTSK
jgi:hypothetical protein